MRVVVLVLVLVLTAVSMTACGAEGDDDAAASSPTTPAKTPSPYRGLPDGATPTDASPAGVHVGDDLLIHVITYGSSGNPALVRKAAAEGQTVTVTVKPVEGRISTMDYVPTTSTFVLPPGVDTRKPVTFVLGSFGAVSVDAVTPGAQAWVDVED